MRTRAAPPCECSCNAIWCSNSTFLMRFVLCVLLIVVIFCDSTNNCSLLLHFGYCAAGALSLGSQREEKLPSSEIPQLATRPECRPNDVRHDENRQNGEIYDWPGNIWPACGMSLPRSRSSRHQQFVSNENHQSVGHFVHDQHNGASPLRSMHYDIELRGQ